MDKYNQTLSELLQSYIQKQTHKNKKLSENRISEQLGIRAPTFNRILNGRAEPSLETLIKLSKFIPEIKKFLPENMFEIVLEKTSGERVGEKLESLLSDPDMFIIYALALSDFGITEDFIIKHYGSQKIKKLKTLEEEGFIKRESNGLGVYRATKNREMTESFQLIKKHIETLNQFYNPNKPDRNYAFYGIDRLNKKGVLEIMKATNKFHEKVADIVNKKENIGDIPVFSTGVSDILFDDDQPFERSNNEIN